MPFHLAPQSRREFLRRSVLASAGLLTIPALRAAAAADPDRWALLSDPHIAADPAAVMRNVHLVDHLRSVVEQVGRLTAPPVGVFINGDCALDRGLAEDYATFTDQLKPLTSAGLPLHMTLGNHDDREVFWTALQDTKPTTPPVASKHVSIVEGARANWFLLDSLDVTKQTPGLLGDEQRAWLAKALDARAEKPALVLVHHNPISPDAAKKTGLVDAPELLEILLPRRHVKAVFFGHTHVWRQFEQDGMHLINLPAVAYPFKPEELTGWVDCKLREGGATLDPRAHDIQHPSHGKVVELNWRAA
jgi:3',5'-cyclic AMP phosphodiesterase CpdA